MPRRQLKAALAFGLLVTVPAIAQAPVRPATGEKFEVASVKISPYENIACLADKRGCSNFGPWGGTAFTATNVSLPSLVELAFGVNDTQLSGADRLGPDRYDISAKPEGGGTLSYERTKPMLRALLEERFKLVAHRETKEVSGYALVVAKGGPKLKEDDGVQQNVIYQGGLQGSQITLEALASMLAKPTGRPVVDKTGIAGKYDIELSYAAEGTIDTSRPSIFTAIQEQLGLKLEPQKVPFEMLVIDRCERVPTEN